MNLKEKTEKSTNLVEHKIAMKKLKKQVKGITLIALVVTIIVLLILAGIALNLTIGQNGIFSRAQTAANTWRNAETNEQLAMGELEGWMANYMGEGNGADNVEEEPISETESFVGYYADTDGDEQADGIIFVDLADTEHSSGRWNNDTDGWSGYEYTPVTEGLKQYTVCSESYTGFNGKWEHPVLTAIDSIGAERFYVMALEDFTTEDYTRFCWYDDAYGKLTDYIDETYNDFGDGRENTINMIREWNLGENGKYQGVQNQGSNPDLWGAIQTAVGNIEKPTWFIPSKSEWTAFGDCVYTKLGVNIDNYPDYGLSNWYWSSSQYNARYAYNAHFALGNIDIFNVDTNGSVRLATTF